MSIFSENKQVNKREFNPLRAASCAYKKFSIQRTLLTLIVIGISGALLFGFYSWISHKSDISIPSMLQQTNLTAQMNTHKQHSDKIMKLIQDISKPEVKTLDSFKKALKDPTLTRYEAKQVIDFTLEHWPDIESCYLSAAQYYIQQQDYKNALSVMSYQPSSIDGHTEYYGTLAYIHLQMRAYSQAEQIYLSLSQVDENNPLWWLGLATIYDITQQNKLAEHAWQKTENYADQSAPYYGLITQRLKHRDIV